MLSPRSSHTASLVLPHPLRHAGAVYCLVLMVGSIPLATTASAETAADRKGVEFFERRIRPLLVQHCYECHSEKAGEQQGELLLDRASGWLEGGATGKAVVPGDPKASLLIRAVGYADEDIQMPPDGKLSDTDIRLLEQWVSFGAPSPKEDLGETEFSRLGDQDYLFRKAQSHWAFQPLAATEPPTNDVRGWNVHPIDRWIAASQQAVGTSPSPPADDRTLARRLHLDLTGLPPAVEEIALFAKAKNRREATEQLIERLLKSPSFGEHFARMWLDVVRYADTDSAYRPDTRTPHYFPFAFTYRDYVIDAFNTDKPYDDFLREQLAADLMGFAPDDPRQAAIGFLTVGPHANRAQAESLDDWIDATTRGLMGMTVACARCHDHKFEPIPTADYYSLHGVFASVRRLSPLDEKEQPELAGYQQAPVEIEDYQGKRAAIDAKIKKAGSSKAKGNNRSVAQKIRETELAELLLFHAGAPARAMIVRERPRPVEPFVRVRGIASSRGAQVPRRFLQILDASQSPFPDDNSGRLQLAEHIVSPKNPLTARVFVNRVWGQLLGQHLVNTPSDFGLQGAEPTHPELLDWLANDFISHEWSLKHLVRTIVTSSVYQQRSLPRDEMSDLDPENRTYWKASRKRLSIETIRDSALAVANSLEQGSKFRPQPLWGPDYTRRRAIYGYINRFNLDPTLRVFDFPTPMQSQPARNESIVPSQVLFTMNSPFIIDQAIAMTKRKEFVSARDDEQRTIALFQMAYQRPPHANEVQRVARFVALQQRFFPDPKRKVETNITSPWPLVAQSLLMSNEFQYLD